MSALDQYHRAVDKFNELPEGWLNPSLLTDAEVLTLSPWLRSRWLVTRENDRSAVVHHAGNTLAFRNQLLKRLKDTEDWELIALKKISASVDVAEVRLGTSEHARSIRVEKQYRHGKSIGDSKPFDVREWRNCAEDIADVEFEYLTSADWAKRLGVSHTTVNRVVRTELIPMQLAKRLDGADRGKIGLLPQGIERLQR